MIYFWTINKHNNSKINVQYHPGKENLSDYVTKHHVPSHHQKLCPMYISMPNSSRYLQHSLQSYVIQGSVKTYIYIPYPSSNPMHNDNPHVSVT